MESYMNIFEHIDNITGGLGFYPVDDFDTQRYSNNDGVALSVKPIVKDEKISEVVILKLINDDEEKLTASVMSLLKPVKDEITFRKVSEQIASKEL